MPAKAKQRALTKAQQERLTRRRLMAKLRGVKLVKCVAHLTPWSGARIPVGICEVEFQPSRLLFAWCPSCTPYMTSNHEDMLRRHWQNLGEEDT